AAAFRRPDRAAHGPRGCVDPRLRRRAPTHRGGGLPDHWPWRPLSRGGSHLPGGAREMKVTLWGTRGSLASPGAETARYGGNTSCVEVQANGAVLVLDAGTGIRRLGATLAEKFTRVDLLLTHLHMDHIQGLGFFAPLYDPEVSVHIWGPASATLDLRARLM